MKEEKATKPVIHSDEEKSVEDSDVQPKESKKEKRVPRNSSSAVRNSARTYGQRDPLHVAISERSSMRRQISYCFAKLNSNDTITMSAFGQNIAKAVQMTEILKARMGLLHQENQFVNMLMPRRRGSQKPREE